MDWQIVKVLDGRVQIMPRTGRIEDLFGVLHDPDRKPMMIEEINKAVALGGAKSGMRGMESWDEPVREEEDSERR
ncbi:MAG: hypothetical protein D3X82_00625 [Candidatus Leucobacter sulfamidivorax]|nr:hypothetical protein [Candidatus Leucobacter sulfamidivorax]